MIVWRNLRYQCSQVWVLVQRTLPLDEPQVGTAVHADFAVRPGLLRNPGLNTVQVFAVLLAVEISLTLRVVAAAQIVRSVGVSSRHKEVRVIDVAVTELVIGSGNQNGWVALV